jgi:membrane-bound lytic murein transglycosylase D
MEEPSVNTWSWAVGVKHGMARLLEEASARGPATSDERHRAGVVLASATVALLAGCATVVGSTTPDAALTPSLPAPTVASAEPTPAPTPGADHPAASAPLNATTSAATGRIGLDSLNPDQAIRFDAPEAKRDLWQRIRAGYGVPDLQNPQLVRTSERWYATRPDYVQRMSTRGARYLFHIVEEVERRQLPTELALLPFIESAFNPQALSKAKASGMWQFMPATGRDFSLKQNAFRDDRRDVLASTRAALDYLTRLHGQFGDWHLALAAYNWGEGNVQRAIQRNQRAGLPTGYESLRMPDETRNYVPKLLAVKNIVMRPQDFGLSLPPLENHPYFLTVAIERDIDVAMAARLAGMQEDEFAALNPQHNRPVILAAGTPHILLPYDNAERFLVELERHKGALSSWTAWVAPRTLRTADAAKLTGMDETRLREVNRIPRGMMIRQGSALLVPRHVRHPHDVSETLADNGTLNLQRESAPKAKAAAQHKATSKPKTATGKPADQAPAVAGAKRTASSSPGGGAGKEDRTRVATGAEAAVRR